MPKVVGEPCPRCESTAVGFMGERLEQAACNKCGHYFRRSLSIWERIKIEANPEEECLYHLISAFEETKVSTTSETIPSETQQIEVTTGELSGTYEVTGVSNSSVSLPDRSGTYIVSNTVTTTDGSSRPVFSWSVPYGSIQMLDLRCIGMTEDGSYHSTTLRATVGGMDYGAIFISPTTFDTPHSLGPFCGPRLDTSDRNIRISIIGDETRTVNWSLQLTRYSQSNDSERNQSNSPIEFTTPRVKPLSELTAADIPRGLTPDDVASDV